MEASELSSGDSLSPLLTSVSSPRFSEPEREGLKPAGYRDSDSRGQEERNIGNVAQEVIGPGREGEFSFPGSTFLVLVSRGKKRDRIIVISSNGQGRQHREKEQG